MRYAVNLLITFLLFVSSTLSAQEPGELLSDAIVKGDTLQVNQILRSYKAIADNYLDAKQNLTPLTLAIKKNKTQIVEILLKHKANPDKPTGRKTPLIYAIQSGNAEIVRLLLEFGAEVNTIDKDGYSPIYYTLRTDNLEIAKMLVDAGAEILKPLKSGKRFTDLITSQNSQAFTTYFQKIAALQTETPFWPVYHDGPYFIHPDSITTIMYYLKHDTMAPTPELISKHFHQTSDSLIVTGIYPDSMMYKIKKKYFIQDGYYPEPEKLMLIGDVHGSYGSLVKLLKNTGVIDGSYNWKWGNGSLAFVGDIFDRGEDVTQTLWLIQRLQDQAGLQGGKVHAIYGNHEFLSLLGDETYLNQKYKRLCSYFMFNYAGLYNEDSELGKWIRTWPGMLKIGNTLVIHAGISKDFFAYKLSVDSVNKLVNKFICSYNDSLSETEKIVLLEKGPFWHRGFLPKYSNGNNLTETFIDSVLQFYNVKRIVFGHTEVAKIYAGFKGKLLDINVPFTKSDELEALLIKNDQLYTVSINGELQSIEF